MYAAFRMYRIRLECPRIILLNTCNIPFTIEFIDVNEIISEYEKFYNIC